jgi:hypothetical protein
VIYIRSLEVKRGWAPRSDLAEALEWASANQSLLLQKWDEYLNEITNLTLSTPMPRIAALKVVEHLVIEVVWDSGFRRGRMDVVDLSPIINLLKLYRPLRNDEVLFRTIHPIEQGRVLAWGEDEQIDMPAESVEELAQETMTPNDLRDFLKTNSLTHNEAAALLDRSRRQIENYLSGKERIPRLFVLACFGLAARKQQLMRGPNLVHSKTKKRP